MNFASSICTIKAHYRLKDFIAHMVWLVASRKLSSTAGQICVRNKNWTHYFQYWVIKMVNFKTFGHILLDQVGFAHHWISSPLMHQWCANRSWTSRIWSNILKFTIFYDLLLQKWIQRLLRTQIHPAVEWNFRQATDQTVCAIKSLGLWAIFKLRWFTLPELTILWEA